MTCENAAPALTSPERLSAVRGFLLSGASWSHPWSHLGSFALVVRGFKKDDPLYKSHRTLHTGAGLLTDKQADRLRALFADDAHVEVEVEATWASTSG